MARIEAMMEALMRDRGLTMTPMGSIEREDSGNDGFRDEPGFAMPPLDPINPALAFMGQPSLFSQDASNPTQSLMPAPGSPFGTEQSRIVHVGNRTMPFPAPAEYQQYLLSFFTDVHLSHPCIDEADFRTRGEHMLSNNVVQPRDNHFLALNYIIFASCDALLNTAPADISKPVGWRWSEAADDLLDKKSLLNGDGDLTLIQCVLFQVSLLFTMVLETLACYTELPRADTNHNRHCTTPLLTCQDQLTAQSASLAGLYFSTRCTSSLPGRISPSSKRTSASACSGTCSWRTASSP